MRTILLALLSVLALGAVTATAAQAATEGPFFKVGAKQLEAGQSQEFVSTGGDQFVMDVQGGPQIQCGSTLTVAPGAKLFGTKAGTPAYLEETISWSKCTVSGGGLSGCTMATLTSKPLVGTLAYSESGRKGDIDIVLAPKTKHVFATAALTGCSLKELAINGDLAAQVQTGEPGKRVAVGKEPAEALTEELQFPSTPIRQVWEETTAIETEELTYDGQWANLVGNTKLELASKGSWGIFT